MATPEWPEFDRWAALPGGIEPGPLSDFGYEWFSNGDGSYYAESRDGLVTLEIDMQSGGGQVNWSAFDDQGTIETGNFSGVAMNDGIFYRADRLLAEFDTRPAINPKGFGYDHGYSEQFPSSYPAPDFR